MPDEPLPVRREICLKWGYDRGEHAANTFGHGFFKPYAVTFDFQNIQIFLQQ